MSLASLAAYGSSDESDTEGKPTSPVPSSTKNVAQPAALPSALDLFNGTAFGTGKASTTTNTSIPIKRTADVAKVSTIAAPPKQSRSTTTTSLRPPQLKRPNIVTEDFKAWNSNSTTKRKVDA